jgi:hypothetical protein
MAPSAARPNERERPASDNQERWWRNVRCIKLSSNVIFRWPFGFAGAKQSVTIYVRPLCANLLSSVDKRQTVDHPKAQFLTLTYLYLLLHAYQMITP